ncbi:pyridoxamine 5'-phosphate oxidase family protein [Arthrobacter burdickii]|uniref:Pyridoxamine 5'-phosphate oxidase family protein n=1 Tax=Arthrobacter burdickii TaxID=3035920 RepID=A0ABT8K392_9MICC|nr:pyridoxamine 5'-phosphate oxidase family protein [Arthrobacter burdickii]MDN4611637.1 pyridoxamine 5'-phosphate oxidase family protein [Arthrobacter burdickii]
MEAETTPTKILAAHECWTLLREAPFGRLALCVQGNPEIFPINFVVDHGSIVFRTSEGTKSRFSERAAVAFEADGLLDGDTLMWSVVVKGHAATISQTPELLATVQLPLHPWEMGRKDRFMRLVPETISGRAFTPVPGAVPPARSSGPHGSPV